MLLESFAPSPIRGKSMEAGPRGVHGLMSEEQREQGYEETPQPHPPDPLY